MDPRINEDDKNCVFQRFLNSISITYITVKNIYAHIIHLCNYAFSIKKNEKILIK